MFHASSPLQEGKTKSDFPDRISTKSCGIFLPGCNDLEVQSQKFCEVSDVEVAISRDIGSFVDRQNCALFTATLIAFPVSRLQDTLIVLQRAGRPRERA